MAEILMVNAWRDEKSRRRTSSLGFLPKSHLLQGSLLSLGSHLGGDAVHVGLALLGEALAHEDVLVGVDVLLGSDKLGILELLEAVADVLGSSHAGVFGAGASALLAAVVATEASGADGSPDVQLVGEGGSAGVEPVVVIGGKLLGAASLNVLLPLNV